jgi:TRAP-type C4-dicarboxylate transport system permease small subunit
MGILKLLDKNIERWALLVFYTMLVITMVVEVFRREIFAYSSIWGEEIVRFSFIYLVWIGASAAVKDRAHIRIDVLFHYLSNRGKIILYIFGDLIMLVVAIFAFYYSFEFSWESTSVTDGLRLDKSWFSMAVPIGFALMLFRLLQSLYNDFGDLFAGREVYQGEKMFD